MITVGLTGGIGSGKTYVSTYFENIGIPVYNSDVNAKKLMVTSPAIISSLKAEFGEKAYHTDGTLNKGHLSSIIFNNPSKRLAINNIVHPAVAQDFIDWQKQFKKNTYCVKEAAIIFETNGNKKLDYTITVYAPSDIRMERIIKRDNSDRKSIKARMDSQFSDFRKLRLTNFVIYNDGYLSIEEQVQKINNILIN